MKYEVGLPLLDHRDLSPLTLGFVLLDDIIVRILAAGLRMFMLHFLKITFIGSVEIVSL